MNVPNKLTLSRLFITVAFVFVMDIKFPFASTVALILFCIASFTDFLDGHIARKNRIITNFGILMDPLADKILTCWAFIVFVELGKISAWMVGLIVAREFAITGLRLLAAAQNNIIAADRWGKYKTISQIVCIISILVGLSYPNWGQWGTFIFGAWAQYFITLSIWVCTLLTIISGTLYLWKNRELYLKEL